MRRVLIPALALNTALLAIIAYELSALAQKGERVATTNGDTNWILESPAIRPTT